MLGTGSFALFSLKGCMKLKMHVLRFEAGASAALGSLERTF